MKVKCSVEEIELEGDYGVDIPSVCVTCSRCGHEVEVYGTSERSVKRGLAMLREECHEDESNFYEADEDSDS